MQEPKVTTNTRNLTTRTSLYKLTPEQPSHQSYIHSLFKYISSTSIPLSKLEAYELVEHFGGEIAINTQHPLRHKRPGFRIINLAQTPRFAHTTEALRKNRYFKSLLIIFRCRLSTSVVIAKQRFFSAEIFRSSYGATRSPFQRPSWTRLLPNFEYLQSS